jgi:hypothetical protein
MTASFWKTVEARGASGAAASDWEFLLGEDYAHCARLLRPTGRVAELVADRKSGRRLSLVPGLESEFDGLDWDDPGFPPVPYSAEEARELAPAWAAVGAALAGLLGFDHGIWEKGGSVRRIGSSQDAFGHVSPVLLFMPPGGLGDYHLIFRELSLRPASTVLFPTSEWFTAEIEALQARQGHAFVDLAAHLTKTEGSSRNRMMLPPLKGDWRSGKAGPKAILHGGHDLAWSAVRIEVASGRTIYLSAPGQPAKPYRLPATTKLDREHALGMLMHLAVHGEWRNPPRSSPDYERVSKAFKRLQNTLQALVPLPGELFTRMSGAYLPVFQIRLHPSLGSKRAGC